MSSNDSSGISRDETLIFTVSQDGRARIYDFADLPCPELHRYFAEGFRGVIRGGRVLAVPTTDAYWATMRRFLGFLDSFNTAPGSLAELKRTHLHEYTANQRGARSAESVGLDLQRLCRVLGETPYGVLDPSVGEFVKHPARLAPRRSALSTTPVYSVTEFAALLEAARKDVAAIQRRIAACEQQLTAFRAAPPSPPAGVESYADLEAHNAIAQGAVLDAAARTGKIPRSLHGTALATLAKGLFLGGSDLTPLLVLAGALTGLRSSEITSLPARHAVDSQTVTIAVDDARARRTPSVHWPLHGGQDSHLHHPGDFYLMLHQLTARGRQFTGSPVIWSVWRGGKPATPSFSSTPALLTVWARRHGLTSDSGEPLAVRLNAIRATVRRRQG